MLYLLYLQQLWQKCIKTPARLKLAANWLIPQKEQAQKTWEDWSVLKMKDLYILFF